MHPPIVIIGIGQLAGVFARAFLHSGHPVYPVTRGMDMAAEAEQIAPPQLVLVAVAEKDFPSVMATLPARWKNTIGLLQNELLPEDWRTYGIEQPTVISVWFEKKKGRDYKVLLPSRCYGPRAVLIADCLQGIDIPCRVLQTEDQLLFELVFKNVFVLTINIAGLALADGATTQSLWSDHRRLAEQIAAEVIEVQQWLTGKTFSQQRLMAAMAQAVKGDPEHRCRGRSAPGRLERVIALADEAGLKIPAIRKVHERLL